MTRSAVIATQQTAIRLVVLRLNFNLPPIVYKFNHILHVCSDAYIIALSNQWTSLLRKPLCGSPLGSLTSTGTGADPPVLGHTGGRRDTQSLSDRCSLDRFCLMRVENIDLVVKMLRFVIYDGG